MCKEMYSNNFQRVLNLLKFTFLFEITFKIYQR